MKRPTKSIDWKLINGRKQGNKKLIITGKEYWQWWKKNKGFSPDRPVGWYEMNVAWYAIDHELEQHIENNNISMVEWLIDLGAQTNGSLIYEYFGSSKLVPTGRPILIATLNNQQEVCALLLARGAVPTPAALRAAIRREHIPITRLLLEHGAQAATLEYPAPEVTKIRNNEALCVLLNTHNIAIAERSAKKQCDINIRLCVSAYDLRFDKFKEALENGADVNFKLHGTTALHSAISHNYAHWWEKSFEVCKLLLENGADPNAQDYNGTTPLMNTAWKDGDQCENAKLLLEYGADPNKQDRRSATALHATALADNKRLCKILLKKNANPNALDEKKATPLAYAVKRNRNTICTLLLRSGANPNLFSYLGYAAYEGQIETCKILLEYDALVNAQFPGETTALHAAAFKKNEVICTLLINHLKEKCKSILLVLMWLKKGNTRLYQQRCVLRPYFEIYSLDKLLKAQDKNGKTAYEYWDVEWLKPKG